MSKIHISIRKRLGYKEGESDADIFSDWKERTSRVCKPCWELKYCPYGPLVEQLPLLPPIRREREKANIYYKKCLETDRIGETGKLTEERRELYENLLVDEDLLLQIAWNDLIAEDRFEEALNSGDPVTKFLSGELPPLHEYRVAFDLGLGTKVDLDALEPSFRVRLEQKAQEKREKFTKALESGEDDVTQPLGKGRRRWFQEMVSNFNPNDYPEEIPVEFEEGACNIFGHICPVFFAAENLTETATQRRTGRYIPFKTKIRVVRRDNYTCQHCGVHLRDDEVEFDHIIPVSKGGSSEEHNLRLTCFDCNRDKADDVEI
ncbi:MAG: HNH endonuclease [Methyloligellaceae bacterium]